MGFQIKLDVIMITNFVCLIDVDINMLAATNIPTL